MNLLDNIFPVFMTTGILLAVIKTIRKMEELRWIERVCIGGPMEGGN